MVEAVAGPPTPLRKTPRVPAHDENGQNEASPVIFQTPGPSPFSVNGSADVPSTRQSKRVNFSPYPSHVIPPSVASIAMNSKSDLKTLTPSNERKPSKSILKSTNTPVPVNTAESEPVTPGNFIMLLHSIAEQLRGESTTAKLDAYMHFFGVLRTYEGVPTLQEVSEKLGVITDYMRKDVTRDLENAAPVDINLVCQALKLSAALIWHTEISRQLSDDFRAFLVDHSIDRLHDAKVPKSVLIHCMSILSSQNFGSKIMNNARLTRLLNGLRDISDRVNGNGIVSQRLCIYHRLLEQFRSFFISQAALWMEHLISGLLHPVKDTRIKSISLGSQLSKIAGPNATLSKTIREIFDKPLGKSKKLVSEICERMSRMMASTDTSSHVPQIWTVIVSLLRSRALNIDQWEHFREWVLVLQKCFNCSDAAIKAQAILGWNRFVVVVGPNEATNPSVIKMLSKPIFSQFERKKQEKNGTYPNQLAVSSYFNLLYFSFHPTATHSFLDTVWQDYIASPSSTIFSSNSTLSNHVAHALSYMLWSSHTRVWTEATISQCTKFDPSFLPALECKWTRSRITSVLKVFENLFKSAPWTDGQPGQSYIANAWGSLSNALSYASSKEITPTPESMQAVAAVLGLLQRLWKSGPSSLNAAGNYDTFFERFCFLSTKIISDLGSIPFTEKLLLKTSDETFQTATTPTHRGQRGDSNINTPIVHLLRLVSDISGVNEPTQSYLDLVNGTLEAFCDGKETRGSRLDLLCQCVDLHPSETNSHSAQHKFDQVVWECTAQFAMDALYRLKESNRAPSPRDYESVVKILSAGLKFADVSQFWGQLLGSFAHATRTEKDDQAIKTMVLEPVAEAATQFHNRLVYTPSISLLLLLLSVSCERPDISQTDVSHGLHLPKKLQTLVHETLRESYGAFDPANSAGAAPFIESLASFLESGDLNFRSMVLEKLQGPLVQWLKDEVRKLDAESDVGSRHLLACRVLSSAVLNIIQMSLSNNPPCLQKFEPIICGGLESSHVSISKRFVDMLNTMSKSDGSLVYSDSISRALQLWESNNRIQPPASSPLVNGSQVNIHTHAANGNSAPDSPKPHQTSEIPAVASHDSSPVVKVDGTTMVSPGGQNQSPLPEQRQADELAFMQGAIPLSAATASRKKREELFSMIENLRSSSPAITPKELGFMTPPHLRNFCNAGRDAEPPLTPTLPVAAAENEDVFLGSSPTPSIRNRPQSSQARLTSSQRGKTPDTHANTDPPSSPPTIKSPSPDRQEPQQPAEQENTMNELTSPRKSPKKKSKKDRSNANPLKEKPVSKRLRSSKKSTQNKQSSKKTESNMRFEEASVSTPSGIPNKLPSTGGVSNTIAESFNEEVNEDVEFQVASQLELDLENAADHEVDTKDESTELPNSFPMAKKRKRGVEDVQTPRSEKRRSNRLTSSQSAAMDIVPELRSTRSTRTSAVASQHNDTSPKSSPAQSAGKRRKEQEKFDVESTEPAMTEQEQVAGNFENNSQMPEYSQNRRRSTRLGTVPEQSAAEESPRKKSRNARRARARQANRENRQKNMDTSQETQETSQETSQDVSQIPDSHPQEEQSFAESIVVQDTVGQKGEKEPNFPVKQNEVQELESSKPTSTEQLAEIQSDIEMNRPEVQPEQSTTQPDVEMEDTITVPKVETSELAQEEHFFAQATQPEVPTEAPTEAPTEKDADTPQSGLIRSFEQSLNDLKSTTLDENSLRQLDELLFKIRVEAHDAFRRHTG